MTTTATRRVEFDAAHRLPLHDGKCRRLHGHSYKVDVTVEGPLAPDGAKRGMVLDFKDLDALIKEIVGHWDHRTILWEHDQLAIALARVPDAIDSIVIVGFMPTAENMAGYIAGCLTPVTTEMREAQTWRVVEVRVQETPRGWATWRPTP